MSKILQGTLGIGISTGLSFFPIVNSLFRSTSKSINNHALRGGFPGTPSLLRGSASTERRAHSSGRWPRIILPDHRHHLEQQQRAQSEHYMSLGCSFPISTEQQHLLPSEDQNSCFLLFLAFFDPDAWDQLAQKIPIFQFFHLSLCSIKASDNFLSPPFLGLAPPKKATCIIVRENSVWAFEFFPRAAKFWIQSKHQELFCIGNCHQWGLKNGWSCKNQLNQHMHHFEKPPRMIFVWVWEDHQISA